MSNALQTSVLQQHEDSQVTETPLVSYIYAPVATCYYEKEEHCARDSLKVWQHISD